MSDSKHVCLPSVQKSVALVILTLSVSDVHVARSSQYEDTYDDRVSKRICSDELPHSSGGTLHRYDLIDRCACLFAHNVLWSSSRSATYAWQRVGVMRVIILSLTYFCSAGTGIQGVSQLLKQSDWAQIQDFK